MQLLSELRMLNNDFVKYMTMRINKYKKEMNIMNKKYITFIVIILSVIIVSFISDTAYAQNEQPEVEDNTIKQDADTDVDDIDLDLFMKDIYSKEQFYNPVDKRDPFRPFIKVVADTDIEVNPEIDPLAPPIRRYKLDQFKLVGVFWLENAPQAMITDPEKNTYMLKIGDQIGNREGKIVEIRENGISVEEKKYFVNPDGLRSIKLSKSILAFKE